MMNVTDALEDDSMGQLGMGEIAVIFIIALLVFGPRKLPELGKSLGKGLREFKKATNELKSSWEDQVRDIDKEVSMTKKDMRDIGKDIENSIKGDTPRPNRGAAPTPATEETAPAAKSPADVASTVSPSAGPTIETPAEPEEKSAEKLS
jgi:TatA/E family protein of Tat protein translocase